MSGTFLDTSALVKHYHAEAGSAEVDRLWNDPATSLFVSRFSAPEIVSALAGKVRTGEISAADFDVSTRRFGADARKKSFTTIRLLARHFKEAERQIRQHGLTIRLRTLDAHSTGRSSGLASARLRDSLRLFGPQFTLGGIRRRAFGY